MDGPRASYLTEAKVARLKAQAMECIQAGRTLISTAQELGVSRETLYNWRKNDATFARNWDASYGLRVDHLEDHAFQRATEGSDQLLMFLLRGGRAERYADKRSLDITQTAQIDVRVLRSLPIEDLLERLTALREAQRGLEIEGNVVDLDDARQVTVKLD